MAAAEVHASMQHVEADVTCDVVQDTRRHLVGPGVNAIEVSDPGARRVRRSMNGINKGWNVD